MIIAGQVIDSPRATETIGIERGVGGIVEGSDDDNLRTQQARQSRRSGSNPGLKERWNLQ